MKQLILIRHAKSSWDEPQLKDFDRPLNKRGKRDGPVMAELLHKKRIRPDHILVSDAARTRETASYFIKEFQLDLSLVTYSKELYHAYPETILELIQSVDDDIDTLFVICHNPGITYLANEFDGPTIYNIPTCGICAIELDIQSWEYLSPKQGVLKEFWYPKMNNI